MSPLNARLLSLDRPLLQASEPSSPHLPDPLVDNVDDQSNQNPPNTQISNHLNHLQEAVEGFEKTLGEDPPVEEDGQLAAELTNAAYKKISTMLIRTSMSIYNFLKYLDTRTLKAEVAMEAQPGVFEALQELSDKMDRFGGTYEKEPSFLEELLGIKAALEKHVRVMLAKMDTFQSEDIEQQNETVETLDAVREGVPNMENNLTGRLHHIHQVQVEQQGTLMETLVDIQAEQEEQSEMLEGKLLHIHGVQLEEHEAVMEKLEEIHDGQMEQENALLEKLNEIEKQQTDAESAHSKWSVIMYGAQGRILDRLSALEEIVEMVVSNTPTVSELGKGVEVKDSVQLQDRATAAVPRGNTPEPKNEAPVSPADQPVIQSVELNSAEVADPHTTEVTSGPLGARWDFLCLCVLVILMLVGLPGGY